MAPMLPTWLANAWANAFSVCVLVSAGELANWASMRLRDLLGALGSAMRMMYQPTWFALTAAIASFR